MKSKVSVVVLTVVALMLMVGVVSAYTGGQMIAASGASTHSSVAGCTPGGSEQIVKMDNGGESAYVDIDLSDEGLQEYFPVDVMVSGFNPNSSYDGGFTLKAKFFNASGGHVGTYEWYQQVIPQDSNCVQRGILKRINRIPSGAETIRIITTLHGGQDPALVVRGSIN